MHDAIPTHRPSRPRIGMLLLSLWLCPHPAWAEVVDESTDSPVQVTNYNLGISNVAPVQLSGSDSRAQEFNESALSEVLDFVTMNFSEETNIPDISAFALDPDRLTLEFSHEIRAYFVAEGAGYHNSLGFTTTQDGETSDMQLVFADASSQAAPGTDGEGATRSYSTPLLPGDFVDLGDLEADTRLDFFTFANGMYTSNPNVWSTHDEDNVDGLVHVVAMGLENTPYLLIGFEDLYGGGDKDYNDLMFVLDFGEENVEKLIGPEPGTLVLLAALGPLALRRRREDRPEGMLV